MAFDGLVMSAVKTELRNTLIGGRLEKIYQPLSKEVVLIIHKERNKFRLLLSADARDARIHLTTRVKENPLSPPLFCMVLRKHLEGGKITDFKQEGLERVLTITVEGMDELGMPATKELICEVMGKHSNIVLVDPKTGVILDGVNRFSFATSRHREILPGRRYVPPPESGKQNPLTTLEDRFRSVMWDPDSDMPVDSLLLKKFEGLSPQSCQEIVYRAGMDKDINSQSMGEGDLHKLWTALRAVCENAASGQFHPTLCYTKEQLTTFSAIDLTRFTGQCQKVDSISHALDHFFGTRQTREILQQAVSTIAKVVHNELKKCRKKIALHAESLNKAEDAEKLRIFGELLTAHIFSLTRGMNEAEVVNYYDPEGNTVCIPLESNLSPAENAQKYFKRYSKTRSSMSVAKKYLIELELECAYLESVVVALEQADQLSELEEIKAELQKEGFIKPPAMTKRSKPADLKTEPKPMLFKLEENWEVLVGRNNRQNDFVTMKLARPEDMWLHAKDIPGAHVIIRSSVKGEVPLQIIETAAQLAAYYSKARGSTKVPVDYTLRKNVRKPKGAKPGMVIYDNQRTVFAEPQKPRKDVTDT